MNAAEVLQQYKLIDGMRSIRMIREHLEDELDGETRRAVILHALAHSRFQFTWSFMAMTFNIHEADWPEKK